MANLTIVITSQREYRMSIRSELSQHVHQTLEQSTTIKIVEKRVTSAVGWKAVYKYYIAPHESGGCAPRDLCHMVRILFPHLKPSGSHQNRIGTVYIGDVYFVQQCEVDDSDSTEQGSISIRHGLVMIKMFATALAATMQAEEDDVALTLC
jgi:hypothetical protein